MGGGVGVGGGDGSLGLYGCYGLYIYIYGLHIIYIHRCRKEGNFIYGYMASDIW